MSEKSGCLLILISRSSYFGRIRGYTFYHLTCWCLSHITDSPHYFLFCVPFPDPTETVIDIQQKYPIEFIYFIVFAI